MPNETSDTMTTTMPPSQQKSTKLRIGWIMPPFVRELPVDAVDDEAAATQLYELVTDLLPNHPQDHQYRFALGLSAQLEPMVEADVIYAGLCPLEVEGRPSLSTMVVSQVVHDGADESEALRKTRETLERKYPDDDWEPVELNCGPALIRVGTSSYIISAEWSASGRELPVTQSQMQAYIPLPGTAEMLIFELSSQEGEDWDLHAELFREILNTVDWGTDQEIADYRAMRSAPSVSAPADPDEAVKKALYLHSSRLLDAIALRGRVGGQDPVAVITCADCWAEGLRTPCSAKHVWHIDLVPAGELPGALSRVAAEFSANGWESETTEAGDTVHAREVDTSGNRVGHSFTLSLDATAVRLTAEVASPCTRSTGTTPTGSVFG
ncbi:MULTISPECIES: hypothetical protein [unclassified Streptomyces]|uniref:hypothetical protein n=1 Tax=unclassified Streptomyces TaxID=2593676 RepID=UPI00036486F7|nr:MULTISPECIES: hypothetical protein [unclassified Streptomyces]MYT29014.1 hypothetical protein [Streptomyces sp. SID8354]